MLTAAAILPADWPTGAYAARLMTAAGPSLVGFRDGAAFDLTALFGTASRWLDSPDPVVAIGRGTALAVDLAAVIANAAHDARKAAVQLQETAFQVVLIDMKVPNGDGAGGSP